MPPPKSNTDFNSRLMAERKKASHSRSPWCSLPSRPGVRALVGASDRLERSKKRVSPLRRDSRTCREIQQARSRKFVLTEFRVPGRLKTAPLNYDPKI